MCYYQPNFQIICRLVTAVIYLSFFVYFFFKKINNTICIFAIEFSVFCIFLSGIEKCSKIIIWSFDNNCNKTAKISTVFLWIVLIFELFYNKYGKNNHCLKFGKFFYYFIENPFEAYFHIFSQIVFFFILFTNSIWFSFDFLIKVVEKRIKLLFRSTSHNILIEDEDLDYEYNFSTFQTLSRQAYNTEILNTIKSYKYTTNISEISEKCSQKSDNHPICSICLSSFELDDSVVDLPICQHQFHKNCISLWVKENDICPYCRGNIIGNINNIPDDDQIVLEYENY